MSRRKVEQKVSKGERRSPRLCALDAWRKAQHQQASSPAPAPAPPSRATARKKRKLKPLEDVPYVPQDSKSIDIGAPESPCRGDDKVSTEKVSGVLSAHWKPEKKILELILDTLQRRDTHEIFAEPVDSEEVEDYYEIIQEPMDFGTMRAKLHEGMYTNLAQFEHDVFLIFTNAMHFNSSTTIYFRQARVIHDLAKRVFHALRTDPANFELEFSEAGRRTRRRSSKEARCTSNSTSSKLTTHLRFDGFPASSSSAIPCWLSSSNLQKTTRQGLSDFDSTSFNATGYGMLSGCGSVQRNDISGNDPHCSYRPWKTSLNESDSVVPTVYSSKHLICVGGMGISYKDSLMLFAEDLGPTVQKVVRRKLTGCFIDAPNFRTPSSTSGNPAVYANASRTADARVNTSSEFLQHGLNGCLSSVFGNATGKGNQFHASGTDESYGRNQMGFSSLFHEEAPKRYGEKIPSSPSLEGCIRNVTASQTCNNGVFFKEMSQHNGKKMASVLWEDYNGPVNAFGHFGGENIHYQQRSTGIWLHPFAIGAKGSMGEESKFDHQAGPLNPACKQEVNTLNLCPGKNLNPLPSHQTETLGNSGVRQMDCAFTNQNSWIHRDDNHETGMLEARKAGSTESGEAPTSSQPLPPSSRFVFDLPYLKSRLDQLNYSRDGKSCWREVDAGEAPSLSRWKCEKALNSGNKKEAGTENFYEGHEQLPSDAKSKHGELTLQL